MTKLAILADIHGNLPALEAVWEDLSQFEVDHVVVAGDVINMGPFSREVLDYLAGRDCAIIRGNHEYYLLDYDTPRAPEEWAILTDGRLAGPRWIHHLVGDAWQTRIATWPDTISLRFPDAPPLRVVHGIPGNPWKGIYPDTQDDQIVAMLAEVEETTIVTAHTHLTLDRTIDRWHVVNPGSVGHPFDGIHSASYLLLESCGDGWHATHRRVPFDRERLIQELERQSHVADHGAFGRLLIQEFRTARQYVGPFMQWQRAQYPSGPRYWTMDLLDGFTDEVRWKYTFPVYHVNREAD